MTLPDDAQLINPAWARPGYSTLAQPFTAKSRYQIALDADFATGKITGKAKITFVNPTASSLNTVVFRLYPNHPIPAAYGQSFSKPRMLIQSATLNNSAIALKFRDSYQSALEIAFAQPLAIGEQAIFTFDYTIQYAAPSDLLDAREAFPMLAVYQPGEGWRTDIMTKSLDYVYSETALYAVNVRAPNTIAFYSTGKVIATVPDGDRVIYQIVTGPVRDFVFQLAKGWSFTATSAGDVPIRVQYKGRADVIDEIAKLAAGSFAYYDKTFGPYPYAGLTILSMVYPSGGEEFPTLIFVDNQRDTNYRKFIVAHEVAHQWFYGVAGNDVARHAWLDESLAQISLYLFYLDTEGKDSAEREWQNILTWANRLKDAARPIDTPVESFADFSEYMVHNYGLGPVFLRELGEKMTWSRFKSGMSEYYQAASLGVGTPAQFLAAMQAAAPETPLAPMFCKRVGIGCQ